MTHPAIAFSFQLGIYIVLREGKQFHLHLSLEEKFGGKGHCSLFQV
jgi:hypothetical protein